MIRDWKRDAVSRAKAGLKHVVLNGVPGVWPRRHSGLPYSIGELEEAVNQSLSGEAEPYLKEITACPRARKIERINAAWSLARHYAANDNVEAALAELDFMRANKLMLNILSSLIGTWAPVLEAALLSQEGRLDEAESLIERERAKRPRIEYDFLSSNIILARHGAGAEPDAARLAVLNRHLAQGGFASLKLVDEAQPLSIGNVTAPCESAADSASGPKVSVIFPVYNGADTIGFAIRSMLEQSWRNIEVIAVDDASTDDTVRVIQSLAARDQRLRLVRHETNAGVYAAQNTGFSAATGDLIQVHGADDWSHSERLALQVRDLVKRNASSNLSSGVRITHDFRYETKPQSGGQIVTNLSSLLLRRSVMEALGGWDRVRFAADAELKSRLELLYEEEPARLHPRLPLALIQTDPNTLTKQGPSSLALGKFGARAEYKAASAYWRSLEGKHGNLRLPRDPRPFPVPRICVSRDKSPIEIEVVHLTNFQLPPGVAEDLVHGWRRAAEQGVKQGVYHWPTLSLVAAEQSPIIRKAIHEGIVQVVVWGETVNADVVVLETPHLVCRIPDRVPSIKARKCLVKAGPDRQVGVQGDWLESVGGACANLAPLLGCPVLALPTSSDARLRLAAANIPVTEQDWETASLARGWSSPV